MGGRSNLKIAVPRLSLVVLLGTSGSGKSTFARKHFLPSEVLSSDFCRRLISDDENDQTVTNEAFALLHEIARKRLKLGKLAVMGRSWAEWKGSSRVRRIFWITRGSSLSATGGTGA